MLQSSQSVIAGLANIEKAIAEAERTVQGWSRWTSQSKTIEKAESKYVKLKLALENAEEAAKLM